MITAPIIEITTVLLLAPTTTGYPDPLANQLYLNLVSVTWSGTVSYCGLQIEARAQSFHKLLVCSIILNLYRGSCYDSSRYLNQELLEAVGKLEYARPPSIPDQTEADQTRARLKNKTESAENFHGGGGSLILLA